MVEISRNARRSADQGPGFWMLLMLLLILLALAASRSRQNVLVVRFLASASEQWNIPHEYLSRGFASWKLPFSYQHNNTSSCKPREDFQHFQSEESYSSQQHPSARCLSSQELSFPPTHPSPSNHSSVCSTTSIGTREPSKVLTRP